MLLFHAYYHSYLGSWDWDDSGLRSGQAKNVHESPSQPMAWHTVAQWEAEIMNFMVPGQLRDKNLKKQKTKICETPSQ
jgi:hypothetical protein